MRKDAIANIRMSDRIKKIKYGGRSEPHLFQSDE